MTPKYRGGTILTKKPNDYPVWGPEYILVLRQSGQLYKKPAYDCLELNEGLIQKYSTQTLDMHYTPVP